MILCGVFIRFVGFGFCCGLLLVWLGLCMLCVPCVIAVWFMLLGRACGCVCGSYCCDNFVGGFVCFWVWG